VDVQEAAGLKELVDGAGQGAAEPGDGPERVRPRAKVGLCPEVLEAVSLRLNGISLGIGLTQQEHPRGLDLKTLALGRAVHEPALNYNGRPAGQVKNIVLVVGELLVGDDLNVVQARAVIESQKAESPLACPDRPDPSAEGHLRPGGGLRQRVLDKFSIHCPDRLRLRRIGPIEPP